MWRQMQSTLDFFTADRTDLFKEVSYFWFWSCYESLSVQSMISQERRIL